MLLKHGCIVFSIQLTDFPLLLVFLLDNKPSNRRSLHRRTVQFGTGVCALYLSSHLASHLERISSDSVAHAQWLNADYCTPFVCDQAPRTFVQWCQCGALALHGTKLWLWTDFHFDLCSCQNKEWLLLSLATHSNSDTKSFWFYSIHAFRLFPPPHHNRFTALFPGPPRWAGARRELLDFMVQGKINSGSHTDNPAGHHSIRTNVHHTPIFLQTGCLSCRPTNSVKVLKATSTYGLGRRC